MARMPLLGLIVGLALIVAASASASTDRPARAATVMSIEADPQQLPPWLRKTPRLIRHQWWVHSRYRWCLTEIIEGAQTVGWAKCRSRVRDGRPYRRTGV